MIHKPVLQKEVIEYLDPKLNEDFIDCTVSELGHTTDILERNKPNGRVLGIEIDKEIYSMIKPLDRLILVNDSYMNLKDISKEYDFKPDGILFDLGMSSWHLEKSGRGFSFLKDEPLDMRYGDTFITAEKIVNEYSKQELERILTEYGEERMAKRIAKAIVEKRELEPIRTTFQLRDIIPKQRQKIHPATRTFQALRIAVNDELNNLKKTLPQALDILKPGGRIVVISFHSLEDRIVKTFFKENNQLNILTKKPIKASPEEIRNNPHSRSAKLRAAKRYE